MTIFTIGYGGLEPSAFVRILTEQSICSLVDIRIWPMRANMGSYTMAKCSEKGIQGLLARSGIKYFSLLELGNPYKDLPDWKKRYRRLIDFAGDVLVERLKDIPDPLCLLCAEQKPDECHRSILAGFLGATGTQSSTPRCVASSGNSVKDLQCGVRVWSPLAVFRGSVALFSTLIHSLPRNSLHETTATTWKPGLAAFLWSARIC